MFRVLRRKKRQRKPSQAHFILHKESARQLVHAKLEVWNRHYGFVYKKVAIRNSRSRWGSCSSKKNLNFNYRILFLPESLQDYLIVHELCHLEAFNHAPAFWCLVEKTLPQYKLLRTQLQAVKIEI